MMRSWVNSIQHMELHNGNRMKTFSDHFKVIVAYAKGIVTKFNTLIASIMANTLSSIACFYVITGMILTALLWQHPKDPLGWIQYIVAFLFQGSALPVLGYVSKREGEDNRKMLQETHDMVMQQFINMSKEQAELKEILQKLCALGIKIEEIDKEVEDIDRDVHDIDKEVEDIETAKTK